MEIIHKLILRTGGKPKYTVKPVLSGHSKIDKIKVLKTNDTLMTVESKRAFCCITPDSLVLSWFGHLKSFGPHA